MHRLLPVFLLVLIFFLGSILLKDQILTAVLRSEHSSSPAINELATTGYIQKILNSNGQIDPNAPSGIWFNQKVTVPSKDWLSALLSRPTNILGESTAEKWIEVDLSTQTLYAHEGDKTVYTFPISSGLPWMPTVTGEFHIWAKLVSTRMIGGSKTDGTYYDLPNVPFTEYFYKGYGLHGAYWHHNFGHPMSHGCVNMRPEDAKTLFYWTNPPLPEGTYALFNIPPDQGTRVVVHGTTPLS